VAVICHPHPLFGGTMDNKVVQTLSRAMLQLGWTTVRFNFRGVGASGGVWDDGVGEVDDALAVIAHHRQGSQALLLAGFSFGAFVAAEAASRLPDAENIPDVPADTLVIHGEADEVVPLSSTFDWARPQSLPVIVFPGVGHFFHGQLALLKRVVVEQLSVSCV
jgi:alpha/beta superfamily hydrolase